MKLIVATKNKNKVEEIRAILNNDAYEIMTMKEAGIETAELYRRKGYAFHTLAEWAEAVRRNGSIPLYSASTSNLASLGLAKKAGGIFFGNGFCVC